MVGQPVLPYFPYDWGFFFDCVPPYVSLKLAVVAFDSDGRKSRDVTHVLGFPSPALPIDGAGQGILPAVTVNIVYPPSSPSPFPLHRSFSTWGTVSGTTPNQNNTTATLSQGGNVVANGAWNLQPPPTMQWQFDFSVPMNISGQCTLTV